MREYARGVIELVVYLEGVGVIGKPRGVFDVEDVVPEALQADDVMQMLPDDAGDGTTAHEAHDDETFSFHSAFAKATSDRGRLCFFNRRRVVGVARSRRASLPVQRAGR